MSIPLWGQASIKKGTENVVCTSGWQGLVPRANREPAEFLPPVSSSSNLKRPLGVNQHGFFIPFIDSTVAHLCCNLATLSIVVTLSVVANELEGIPCDR